LSPAFNLSPLSLGVRFITISIRGSILINGFDLGFGVALVLRIASKEAAKPGLIRTFESRCHGLQGT
jgi:hypothetical protein